VRQGEARTYRFIHVRKCGTYAAMKTSATMLGITVALCAAASSSQAESSASGQRIYRWVSANSATQSTGAPTTVFLDNCLPNGCDVSPGTDDGTAAVSSIPTRRSTIQPFAHGDQAWHAVVACVQKMYAPFNVTITDQRPTGNFHRAIIAGTPHDVQVPAGVLGVSPFNCSYIDHSVSFAFANSHQVYNGSVDDLCWTVAQEIAHGFGLDHKYDARDPMTYLSDGPSVKRFVNEAGSCGEDSQRTCACGGTSMNSFKTLADLFGTRPIAAPTLGISSPAAGQAIDPGFVIRANASSEVGILRAEFRVDGRVIGSLSRPPFAYAAPKNLGQGMHRVEVVAIDSYGNRTTSAVDVVLGAACSDELDCDSSAQVCVSGRCVMAPGQQGGLGTSCMADVECSSRQCAFAGEQGRCVESCLADSAVACPTDFACVQNTSSEFGLCWPTAADSSNAGCQSSNHNFLPSALIVLMSMAVAMRRKSLTKRSTP
jgi:hypothetical protein